MWVLTYLSPGVDRKARRWAWFVLGGVDNPPSGGILLGTLQARVQRPLRVSSGSKQRSPVQNIGARERRGSGGSLGPMPIPLSPFAFENPQVLAAGLVPPTLYDSREPTPLFVTFMKVFLGCIPWLHIERSCVVRSLWLRMHVDYF